MVMCADCGKEMIGSDTCTVKEITIGGVVYQRSTYHFPEPTGRCHDCGIKHGGYHHPGCDVERCPRCGGQLITCGCLDIGG